MSSCSRFKHRALTWILSSLTAASLCSSLSAQTTITYTNGQNDAANYDTSAPNDPVTLTIVTGTATQSGILSGNGSVFKTGAGTLILSNANTYSGTTTVNEGLLEITLGGAITQTSNVGVTAGGTLMVNGAGSALTSVADVNVGSSGSTGTLSVLNGGTVSASAYGYIGIGTGAVGTVTVDGAGSALNSQYDLNVGYSGGTGTLSVLHGGTVASTNGNGFIGYESGSVGTVTVDGAGSAWTMANVLYVGSDGGTGTLSVLHGGTVSASAYGYIGTGTGAVGTVTVDGAGSALTMANDLVVGIFDGTGTLNLQNGGSVSVRGGTGVVYLGYGGGAGTGTLNIGSTGTPTTAGTLLAGEVYGEGTAVVNFNQTDITTFKAALTGDLSVNQNGPGTTQLSGASTYTGGTHINAGALTAFSGSALGSGSVILAANTGLNYQAMADAMLSIGGDLTIHGTGEDSAFIGGSIGSTATSAQINVAGAVTASAGLVLVNVFGIDGVTPLVGGTYTLLQGGAGSDLTAATEYGLGTVFNNTSFTLDPASLNVTADQITIDVTAQTALTAAFWKGGLSGAANVWAVSNGTTQSNWASDADGTVTALVPGSAADVFFSATGATNATATVLGADMTIGSLNINDTVGIAGGHTLTIVNSTYVGGKGVAGTLSILSGTTLAGNVSYIGSAGHVTVDGVGSAWTSTSGLTVGNDEEGTGTLTVQNGGRAAVLVGTLDIGIFGANGQVTVTGAGSNLTASDLHVGHFDGTGTLSILSGGRVTVENGFIGSTGKLLNAVGTVTVDGAGSAFTSVGNLNVGYSGGTGTLSVLHGGTVSTNGSGYIGNGFRAVGTVTVDGAGSTWILANDLYVGYSGGTGMLSVLHGGAVASTNGTGFIGYGSGSVGTVTVDGAGSAWTSEFDLNVGINGGTGTLSVLHGGTVASKFGTGYIGANFGSVGTVTVDGEGSALTSANGFLVGSSGGRGTLSVLHGGTVASTDDSSAIGSGSGSVGTVTVDGAGSA